MAEIKTNGIKGDELRTVVEKIERLREEKKALAGDEKVVMAEASATGFDPKIIRHVVKVRGLKPSAYQEAQDLTDVYLSALGMAPEPPLFRAIGLMSVDIAAREQVIEVLKKLVPLNGSIVVEAGGTPVRLTRSSDGAVAVAEVSPSREKPSATQFTSVRPSRPAAPDVEPDEAENLGVAAAKADQAIITNPFGRAELKITPR